MHSFPPPPHSPILFPTRNSELGTLHSFPPLSSHSALSTLHSALREALSTLSPTLNTKRGDNPLFVYDLLLSLLLSSKLLFWQVRHE
uniref:Uncharacterized protein n=1 Tax=Desertifilum tharense IPPAS B-1220 TaxID=1781255 RepID=A0ACD5GZ27_9CYAN